MTSGKTYKAAIAVDKKVVIKDLPYPVAVKDSIIIKNKVTGFNYADLHQLQGKFHINDLGILGLETTGEVIEVGEGVTKYKVGDRVVALGQASHAEYSLLTNLDAKVHKIPDNISYESAAALAIQALTAITLIEGGYKVKKGDVILVQAVAGGVGSLLAQLIHDKGATVIGTTSSKEKTEFAKKNGADYVINYKEENILERVLEITKGEGVNAVLDSVGGPEFEDSIKATKYNGVVVAYGIAGGEASAVEIRNLFAKNVHVAGSTLFNYFTTPAETEKWWNRFFELVSQNKLDATIYKTYSLDNISEAFDALESGITFGKLLLSFE